MSAPPRPYLRALVFLLALVAGSSLAASGLLLAAFGVGFANTTACGPGLAIMACGLWTASAARALTRVGLRHLPGLCLGWLACAALVAWDHEASLLSGMLGLFLMGGVAAPCFLVAAVSGALLVGTTLLFFRRGEVGPSEDPGLAGWRLRLRNLLGLGILVGFALVGEPSGTAVRRESFRKARAEVPVPAVAPTPTWGACTSMFLGYELTTNGAQDMRDAAARHQRQERNLRQALAELASIQAAGARLVRVGASGDHLQNGDPEQEALDDRYMAAVRETGIPLVLVDTQHPQRIPVRPGWEEFCRFQRRRIEYYTRRYRPAVYLVVCEPSTYHSMFLREDVEHDPAAWAAQLSEMCRLVKEISPETRTGLCLLLGERHERDWGIWSRMQALPELDLLSVEIYQPDRFTRTVERLARHGHPREHGKRFWIAETFHGWAMARARPADLDVAWLELCRDASAVMDAEAILVWTFGTFVPGGSYHALRSGRLSEQWGEGRELSRLGRTFRDLAAAGTRSASAPGT